MSEEIELLEPQTDQLEESTADEVIFWRVKYQEHQETGAKYVKDVTINYLKLIKVFYLLGFRRLDIDQTYTFVKIENNRVVKKVSVFEMVDVFFDLLDAKNFWLDEHGTFSTDMLKEKFYKSPGSYFKEDKLTRLRPERPIKFNKDSLQEKFIYFENGFVSISKAGIIFDDYSKLQNYIWESEILKRKYLPKPAITSPFQTFLMNICGAKSGDVQARFDTLKRIIGYYLHSYTDCELRSLVLTDSKISEENEANGRTGKTLFSKAMGYMLSNNPEDPGIKTFIDINGKDFDPKEKHKYQEVGIETKIICINDLKRGFDVDCLFNDITEGVKVEEKNMKPFKVKAKMILTTNKTIKIEGESAKARFLEFEFADHYSKNYRPDMEFKHRFFRDWDPEKWAAFDWLMFESIQAYFIDDCQLNEPEHINLNARKLRETTNPDFLDFMSDIKIEYDRWYNKKDMFNAFINRYEDFKKDQRFNQKKFTGWVKLYTKYNPEFLEFNKERDEKRSDDVIEMCFRKNKPSAAAA